MISAQVDRSKRLTVFTMSGDVAAVEIMRAVASAAASGPTPLSLWDIRSANMNHISSAEVQAIVRSTIKHGYAPDGARAAVVASGDLDYIAGRLSESVVDDEADVFELSVFREYDEAVKWLTPPANEPRGDNPANDGGET